jgi:hypothetical protein
VHKGVRQLVVILGVFAALLLGHAFWRGTAATWIGTFLVMAAVASAIAVSWPDSYGEED